MDDKELKNRGFKSEDERNLYNNIHSIKSKEEVSSIRSSNWNCYNRKGNKFYRIPVVKIYMNSEGSSEEVLDLLSEELEDVGVEVIAKPKKDVFAVTVKDKMSDFYQDTVSFCFPENHPSSVEKI